MEPPPQFSPRPEPAPRRAVRSVGFSAHMKFIVTPEDAGQRLDLFLVSQLPALSRSRIKSLMDEGRVQVDGYARKASHHTETGEVVAVEIPDELPPGVEPESIPLDVLYEDADVA